MTTIRKPIAADFDAWNELWQGYLRFYRQKLDAAITETTWKRVTDADASIQGLVAVDGADRPIGLVHYLFHPVTWSASPRCYLEDLYVAPEARGSGAGRALIEAVYAAADEAGADQVYWLTEDSNETARKLYDRVGRLTTFVKYQR